MLNPWMIAGIVGVAAAAVTGLSSSPEREKPTPEQERRTRARRIAFLETRRERIRAFIREHELAAEPLADAWSHPRDFSYAADLRRWIEERGDVLSQLDPCDATELSALQHLQRESVLLAGLLERG